jgi:glycosyltransferase involved in cell wall biosynthesis
MRVLNVNKFHYRRAGAETAYFNLARLLEQRGHEVVPFAMQHPQNEATEWDRFFPSQVEFRARGSFVEKTRRAARVIYSREARNCLRRLLAEAKPDIAHLHNIAHQLSPSILDALREAKVPVVQTLHDYKLTCPVYTHRTGGRVCERCKGGRFYYCAVYRCNGHNLAMSMTNAVEMTWHRMRGTYDTVDIFVCPSTFVVSKCLEYGIPRERLAFVPHFVFADDYTPHTSPGDYALYAGRLAEEKGLWTLLAAHAKDASSQLVLAGDGPMREALEAFVRRNGLADRTRFTGHLQGEDYETVWREAAFLVVPSEWFEVRPMVIHESYARGKPVVTTRIGTIPEIVREGETGLLFAPGDAEALSRAMVELLGDPVRLVRMGRAARGFVENELTPQNHATALEAAYERARARRQRSRVQ